ncbi:TetR/AcrR family transcriptional regulator [Streptomyces sp. FXJ7.023]|uniref:TetR/AcrR family transcriptional regulator n=1 Tax=Streptomyces sp. FXJ7.023 TaxID=579932 RepID=UPI000560C67C|nr:TetR/AcrR family transcriptional regulator [Streptomyces sp. FXJ7.023]
MTASKPSPAPEDRRRRKALRTRDALATAACDLILERGPAAATVEAIAERADVTRRTFSRHFAGKEDAALDFVRRDGDRVNALLRTRPAGEPPLLAYRRAVHAWLADPEDPAWHVRPRMRRLLALADTEPDLFAAYQRIRLDAQAPPAAVVDAAAGALIAALRLWARAGGSDSPDADLAALVERAYDALAAEAAAAAAARDSPATRA